MADRAMTEEELLSLVESEMDLAMGHPQGEIAQERAKAWRYFFQEPLGNEVEGSSQVVTSDVADVVEDVLPSLLRIFTSRDNLVEFSPVGPEDAEEARQASDYVSWIFFQRNRAFEVLYNWAFDGLLQINGFVKAFWDDAQHSTIDEYEGLTEEQFAALEADEELELVEHETREAEVPRETIDPASGQTVQLLVEETVHDATFRRTQQEGQVVVENVPPEEMRVSADARGLDLSRARMVGQERLVPRSELVAMGWDRDVVEKLPAAKADVEDSPEELARETRTDERDDQGTKDRSLELVRVQDCYPLVDFDGDGQAERRRVFAAGGKILENVEVSRHPFHAWCPQPIPHKHFGRSWAQKVFDVHDVSTTLLRQTLDNLYHSNTPGFAVTEQGIGTHTMDDLLTARAGSVKRFKRGPISDVAMPISVPFTAGQSFAMLEVLERIKHQRTGVSVSAEGLTPDALKNIQQSVMAQAMDTKQMKIELVARIFAETGLRSLFLHIHELTRKHQQAKSMALLRGKWVPVDPRGWRLRRNMRVKIGLGLGTRERNLLHLEAIYQKQVEAWQNGGAGILVTPRNLFNSYAAIVENANMLDPETFFTDPGDVEVPPPGAEGDQVAQLQQQIAQLQARIQAREQDIDRERNLLHHQRELAKIELAQQKQALDRQKQEEEVSLRMEEIKNRLTELELKHGENVPGSRV